MIFAALLAAVLLIAGGVWLVVTALAAGYVWGLALAALGLCLLVFVSLPMPRRWVRAAMCVVLAAAVVGTGLWVPRSLLAGEFAGASVRWAIPSRAAADDTYYDHEFIMAVINDAVVLANRVSARVVSLEDGHELGTLPANRDDQFSVAGRRLLVVGRTSAMLFDRTGKPVWPAAVTAERGVAADLGTTVVEKEGVASAIADDGSVRWTRHVDEERAGHNRIPTVSALPADNVYVEHGPPVLPRVAALPVSDTTWEFVDMPGGTVSQADGEYGGWVRDTPMTATKAGDRCQVWLGGKQDEVECTYGKPWAQGEVLFIQNGADAWALAGLLHLKLADAALSPDDKDRRLTVSSVGMAWRDGRLIRGYPELGYDEDWRFVAESEYTTTYAGAGIVVVATALRRTIPLDPRPGVAPGESDYDQRLTVHSGQDGDVLGSVRVHEVGSVHPVENGALVAADGKIMLIA